MKSEAGFSFHLDGNSAIDAGLLSNIIRDMAELTKLAAQEENPGAYLKMNVTAFRNGSFQIDFSTVCEASESLLSSLGAVSTLALTVVGIVKGFFEIKKHLKGDKPKNITATEDNKVIIEAQDGNTICVSKSEAAITNNVQIDQLIVNISNCVVEHNPNGGFTFRTDKEDLWCSSDDVKVISKPMPIEETVNCQRSRYEAILPIKSLDLLGHSQWSFKYNERTIKANVVDDDFIEKIHSGEFVKAGDCIKATLEIYVDLDILGKPIEGSEKYTVLKVHGGIIHSQDYPQMTL